jgi:leader peptidase (prepilin peptidase) / N-methyltransferase
MQANIVKSLIPQIRNFFGACFDFLSVKLLISANILPFLLFLLWSLFLYWLGLWLVSQDKKVRGSFFTTPFYLFCLCSSTALLVTWTLSPSLYFPSYFIFVSALITIFVSDSSSMLISTATTVALVPVGILCAYYNKLPISVFDSIFGSVSGFLFLWIIAFFYYKKTGKRGLGEGDMDMLAMIGAFLGPIGWWATITIASITGTVLGLLFIIKEGNKPNLTVPFGPFLATGSFAYLVYLLI